MKTKEATLSQTAQVLSDLILKLQEQTILSRPNELSQDVQTFDNSLALAFMSGRPELVKMSPYAKGEQVPDAEQTRHLYQLIMVLLETNQLLQRHAISLGQLTESWMGHFKGLLRAAREIEAFAKFERIFKEEQDEE